MGKLSRMQHRKHSLSHHRNHSSIQGNNAALCFTISSNNSANVTSTSYFLFRVKIDQFSSLKLTGLASLLNNASAVSATVTVQFQNQDSGLTTTLLNKGQNIQRTILSVVVNTVGGGFDSIKGDSFCDSSCGSCYEGDCYDNYSASWNDLVVYVSWAGSDSKNDQYLSQSQRLSRFSLYSVSSVYSSVKSLY